MFGHEESDWMSPFESVPAVSTTSYIDEPAGPGFGLAPAARPRATGKKRARKARSFNRGPVPIPRSYQSPFPPSGDLVHAENRLRAQALYHHAATGFAGLGLGFGDATVPFTTSKGVTGTATATTQASCGSLFGVQQMLSDLGYHAAVDGIYGPETSGALSSFAQEHGVPYQSGTLPSGQVCQALEDAWLARGSQPTSPDVPVLPPSGGTSMPATTSPGITDSIKNWWTSQTTTTKYLIAGGGAVAGALLIAALVKTPSPKRAHA